MALTPKQLSAASRTLFSGISAYENYNAGQDAEAIGEFNAATEEMQTNEEVRRMENEQARTMGLAQARAAASGASGQTSDIYMDALAQSGEEEVDWLRQVGASKYDQALAEGRMAKNAADANFWGNISDIGLALAGLI